MKFNIKNIKGKKLIFFAVLLFIIALVGFLLRFLKLTTIPVFADEAIYIRWAQVMRAESTLRFLPLSDGKQPLFMWIVIPFLKLIHDPLIAGRIVSILSGTATTVGIGILSFLLFKSKKAALVGSIIYIFSPFTFFFDRLALADSMLTSFTVWFLVFLVIAIKNLRWDFSMLAGFMLGCAFLTKSPALFSMILIPSSVLLLDVPTKTSDRLTYLLKIGGIWITVALIGFGMSQILRLGPNFQMIAIRNLDYVFPFTHIFTSPKDPLIFNLDRSFEWVFALGPVWLFVLSLLGIFGVIKRRAGAVLFLLSFYVFPLLVNAEYARVFTARYILYTLPPLFVFAGIAILHTNLLKKLVFAVFLIFIVHSSYINYQLATAPDKAPLPQTERSGYLEEWSAGWGIKQSADIILAEHQKNPDEHIVVGTEGYFGTLPDGLQIYLEKVPNVTVVGTGLNFKTIPDQLVEAKKAHDKVYFAVNSSRLNKEFKPNGLTLLYSVVKPDRELNTHEHTEFGPRETYYFFEVN